MNVAHHDNQIYAASCNPSRRAKKRPRSESLADLFLSSEHPQDRSNPSSSETVTHRDDDDSQSGSPAMPSKPAAAALGAATSSWGPLGNNDPGSSMTATTITNDGSTQQRRGRKATSRAAREAQRKLNHSMIEKVRRTRINEALATLKSLVPVDYGRVPAPQDEDDDADETGGAGNREDDGEEQDEHRTLRKKPAKGPSKKDERERDYKLEILIRTVAYLQDLIEKVKVLEADRGDDIRVCSSNSSSSADSSSGKRKRTRNDDGDHDGERSGRKDPNVGRLPSISSWLPPPPPAPFTGTGIHVPASSSSLFHLPSPPLSTLVDPVKATLQPPALTLDLPATYKSSPRNPFHRQHLSLVTTTTAGVEHHHGGGGGDSYLPASPRRTPDDESAASLLLQISNSPTSRPVHSSASAHSPVSPSSELPKAATRASDVEFGSGRRRPPPLPQDRLQAQTPSSLLGLDRAARRRHT